MYSVRLCSVHQLCNWCGVGIANYVTDHFVLYTIIIIMHNIISESSLNYLAVIYLSVIKLNSFSIRDCNKVMYASINSIHRVTTAMATVSPT